MHRAKSKTHLVNTKLDRTQRASYEVLFQQMKKYEIATDSSQALRNIITFAARFSDMVIYWNIHKKEWKNKSMEFLKFYVQELEKINKKPCDLIQNELERQGLNTNFFSSKEVK